MSNTVLVQELYKNIKENLTMNNLLNALKTETNFTYTENGALTHKTTGSALLDLFAMGAAMRNRSDEDVILMFKKAFAENPQYAMKCLFYIRDIRGGQGERRFFKTILHDIAENSPHKAEQYIPFVPVYGRWDDLYCFVNTPIEEKAFDFMKKQFELDLLCDTPSLLGKWLKSENASSKETRLFAMITRNYFGLTSKQYRQSLSSLRSKINIVEKLMSSNQWDKIEFDKIPSKAGFIYRNAFARRDIICEKYTKFAFDKDTRVNADTLYPYEVVARAWDCYLRFGNVYTYGFLNYINDSDLSQNKEVERAVINKYWDNLTDYLNGCSLNALAMIDTSGSMIGTPMNVAVSLGLYCAERASGPFANHYISFSSRPQLIECEGVDFVDKVGHICKRNLCENTNIEAAFELILNTATYYKLKQEDLPENIIIISDMEFDAAQRTGYRYGCDRLSHTLINETLLESISKLWGANGYIMPKLIFWNVDARQDNIPMKNTGRISYVSGFSPTIFEAILTGKTAEDLMYDILDRKRYSVIN